MIASLALSLALLPRDSCAQLREAYKSLSPQELKTHIETLASDQFEGRLPGTRGEALSVDYLEKQYKELGLAPGNPDGTYIQRVPLMGITGKPKALFVKGEDKFDLRFPFDFVAVSRHTVPLVEVKDSMVVFVGYGVVAPEYRWDDYKGVDVRGKTLLMLINDPQVPDPKDPSKLDERMFKGKAMTYYGRWTYKYEIASAKGAAAAVIIHETGPAGYPYGVIMNSWGRENFDIRAEDGNVGRVPVEAWVSSGTAARLLSAAGLDFAQLKRKAVRRDFKPVELAMTANFTIENAMRQVDSQNVLAKLEGSDPKLKDEFVVYTAHWDHLGKDEKLKGDQIYNGAFDNASGVASTLALAKAFSKLKPRPKRSVLFFNPTAEEQGLLGSKFYAANALYPLKNTLAVINIDGMNVWGKTRDITSIGFGYTSLDNLLVRAAKARGRRVAADPETEKGFYFRSDHFEFAKLGVPGLDYGQGIDFVGKPAGWGRKKKDDYTANHYHQVSDEVQPDWDLSGAVEDLRLLLKVGWDVAQGPVWPVWKPGAEFKAAREASLR